MKFFGAPYPIVRHPRGFLRTQEGINQVKSDLLCLLLTEPGERVMLPEFGTPLKRFFFEPNDGELTERVREAISNSIRSWEPRIAVTNIKVATQNDEDITKNLNENDPGQDIGHILLITIKFTDFDNVQEVQELKLEIPLGE